MKNAVRIFLFLSAAIAFPAAADVPESFYRVEVIIFQHADGRADAHPVDELEDFSGLTDPLERERQLSAQPDADPVAGVADGADATAANGDEVRTAVEALERLAQLEEGSLMPALPKWPEPYVALESLSDRMRSALDRLDRSPDYRPLTWRAWHQPIAAAGSVSRVRLHDEQVIAESRLEMEPVVIPEFSEASEQGGEALQPHFHYRLDGGIRLHRRQFMHAEARLHWREQPTSLPGGSFPAPSDSGRYEIHRLEQSRTIRPGRIEYFDSSLLGLLILVERIEPLDGSGDEDRAGADDDGG